jgi:hypothetical protein
METDQLGQLRAECTAVSATAVGQRIFVLLKKELKVESTIAEDWGQRESWPPYPPSANALRVHAAYIRRPHLPTLCCFLLLHPMWRH